MEKIKQLLDSKGISYNDQGDSIQHVGMPEGYDWGLSEAIGGYEFVVTGHYEMFAFGDETTAADYVEKWLSDLND